MRFNLALALSISILLIGGSVWVRLYSSKNIQAQLVAVQKQQEVDSNYFDEAVFPVLEKSATSSAPSAEPLNSSDLIGRQLILDYVSMASSGQISEDNLNSLATKYIDSIPSVTSAPVYVYGDLSLGSSERTSLQAYADGLTKIYDSHTGAISREEATTFSDSEVAPDYLAFAGNLGSIYLETVQKLKALKVPPILAQTHLGLINSYLSSGTYLKTVSDADKDSTSAFAGLLAMSDSVAEEKGWYDQIAVILNSNGI